ncbi:MAG TPA: MBL fold metallo-hydrolase [Flavipsychrobacter sp.]|nr:MBL fold metallo-hydrolase [Flavipsychrobacter sp.]
MKITFLGTGTSQGVPVISCPCEICHSKDIRDTRLRSSVWIETGQTSIVIDAGPDFRQQMLTHQVNKLDAVLFTHSHKDHIAGLDDVRAYNYFQQKPMEVYATDDTQQALRREYAYIFENAHYPGVPQLNLNTIHPNSDFTVNELTITPIKVMHYQMEVLGFRINDFTYITDANEISSAEIEKIKGSRILVLNALRREKHISHFTLDEAVEMAKFMDVPYTLFTHISHQLGLHEAVEKELSANIRLAYDGMEIVV